MNAAAVCWVDGRIVARDEPAIPADDSAFCDGRGCYTSALVRDGVARFADRHVRRLETGARALGLPAPSPGTLHDAFRELGHAAFGDGAGVVRLQLSRDPRGRLHVVGVPRGLGEDPVRWRAITAPERHPGVVLSGGLKLTHRLGLTLAGEAAREAGVEEALLFDAAGRLVEGSRSNVVLRLANGTLATPPAERGAVAGVALSVLLDHGPDLRRRDVSRRGLGAARGVAMVNAVRGARPLVALDGEPLGEESTDLARELDAVLERG